MLVATVALGDQRELRVAITSPAQGESVAVTTRSVSLSFAKEPDHAAVEKNFYIEPPFLGSFRWRGKTAEYIFVSTLDVGPVTVILQPGSLGAGGEKLSRAFVLKFEARSPGYASVVQGESGDTVVASFGSSGSAGSPDRKSVV